MYVCPSDAVELLVEHIYLIKGSNVFAEENEWNVKEDLMDIFFKAGKFLLGETIFPPREESRNTSKAALFMDLHLKIR